MRDFHLPGRSTVFATNGLCATSHPLAAQSAVNILQSGGNAVDAAIGAAVLLGICEPQMTGIGGDCFVLFSPAGTDDILALNGSGRAPKALDAQTLRAAGHEKMPESSASSVTVPGAIDAFCRLSEDWGKLGLAASLAPAIHYAEEGVPTAPRVAFDLKVAADNLVGAGRDHYLINGKTPALGQVFRAPGQAEVLRQIAKNGRSAFYEGEIAEDMVRTLNAAGGVHTLDDFAKTACEYTDPVSGDYKGVELVEHPPNGQGATAILMNNILANFDVAAMDPFGAERAHIEAEAAKLAYDARNRFIADLSYTTRLEHMLSLDTAAKLAGLIDPKRAMANTTSLSETVHKDTVYLTVVDKDQMSVSLIYSIYSAYGSGIASDKYGILLQNRGEGFNLEPGHPNEAGGGKRPMHTIIPAMTRENGRVTMPFGVMGGAYQPNGHSRMITNMVDFGMDAQASMDAPRCFSDKGEMTVERGYDKAVADELQSLGHKVIIPDAPLGGGQIIRINHADGVLEGASDPRKDGCALGY